MQKNYAFQSKNQMPSMPSIDDLFGSATARVIHPKARYWIDFEKKDEVDEYELEFRRPKDGIVYRPAKFFITFYDSNKRIIQGDESDWELDLHQDLNDGGLRCKSNENESERFGFAFKELFRKAENRFGDGYFNSVFLRYIYNSWLAQYDKVKKIIGSIHRNQSSMQGQSYGDCEDMIELVLKKDVAESLNKKMMYSVDDTKEIIASAVAYYLDERFNITNRRLLGFL